MRNVKGIGRFGTGPTSTHIFLKNKGIARENERLKIVFGIIKKAYNLRVEKHNEINNR